MEETTNGLLTPVVSERELANDGSVYVAVNELGMVKVGITGDVGRRIMNIETATGIPTLLLHSIRCGGDAQRLEQKVLNVFGRFRQRGEWLKFDVPGNELAVEVTFYLQFGLTWLLKSSASKYMSIDLERVHPSRYQDISHITELFQITHPESGISLNQKVEEGYDLVSYCPEDFEYAQALAYLSVQPSVDWLYEEAPNQSREEDMDCRKASLRKLWFKEEN